MSDPAALGWQNPGDFGSGFNSQIFLIWSILSRIAGSTIVEVVGVNTAAGTVDIHPLVNQLDGYGNAIPHGTIYECPYFQLQSGTSAVIIPPTIGDIGFALFADRDISGVVANRKQSNPGSNRMFDYADGMYLGGALNVTPTQFIQFVANGGGVTIKSPTAVTVNAPVATVTATTSATVTAPTATINGDNVRVHATTSYAQDVNGYGTKTTHTGGTNWTVDSYVTGATVTSNTLPINPPEIP